MSRKTRWLTSAQFKRFNQLFKKLCDYGYHQQLEYTRQIARILIEEYDLEVSGSDMITLKNSKHLGILTQTLVRILVQQRRQ